MRAQDKVAVREKLAGARAHLESTETLTEDRRLVGARYALWLLIELLQLLVDDD